MDLFRNASFAAILPNLFGAGSLEANLVQKSTASSLGHCNSAAFPFPTLFGAEILSIEAALVQNYTHKTETHFDFNVAAIRFPEINFCNITVIHTHPGQNDKLQTQVWLPLPSEWNGRFQMIGGGGWAAGLYGPMFGNLATAVNAGYASSMVNAGVSPNPFTPETWALISDGNVDYVALQNFAYKGIHDGALITKEIIKTFYGGPATYSYWTGCSQGGRQGHMFAQRFPEVFDGILGAAPAINFPEFFLASRYLAQVVNELGEMPFACEFDAFYKAAIAACDDLDGLADGLISRPDLCSFDPYTLVGSPADCSSSSPPGPSIISHAAAVVVDSLWNGVRAGDGSLLWPTAGYEIDIPQSLLLNTECAGKKDCAPDMFPLFETFLRFFVMKNPAYNTNKMTREEYVRAFRAAVHEYSSILGTSSPDLTEFRESGHKLLTWHGLADALIPYNGTRRYYDAVTRLDPTVHSYYRFFEAPGVGHCFGGIGGQPHGALEALVTWVENGIAPDSLVGTNPKGQTNLLCPYPKKSVFKGKSPDFKAEDFECSD